MHYFSAKIEHKEPCEKCAFGTCADSEGPDQPTIRRANSGDLDQPAHPRSLIRVFTDHVCLLQPRGYPKGDKRESLPYWLDAQADLSLCWSHRSHCKFCRATAQISM